MFNTRSFQKKQVVPTPRLPPGNLAWAKYRSQIFDFERLGLDAPTQAREPSKQPYILDIVFKAAQTFLFLMNQEEPEAPTANALKETKSTVTKSEEGEIETTTALLGLFPRNQGTEKKRKKIQKITSWN